MIRIQDIEQPNDINDIYKVRFGFVTEYVKNSVKFSCDNIITFDIESSSGMYDPKTGRAFKFDKEKYDADFDKPETERAYQEYIGKCKPVAIMYIWQICVESKLPAPFADESELFVFTGRTWDEFKEFMENLTGEMKRQLVYGFETKRRIMQTTLALKDKRPIECYIFDHNLGFEMCFLANLYNKDFSKKKKVFAREACNPMKIRMSVNKVSVNWRDTVCLTQKSLYEWTHDEKLPIMKLEEPQTFYEDTYTPITPIEPERLKYAINDVVSMAYGMEKYRNTYGTLSQIPLTQTGTVRLPARSKLWENDPDWCRRCCEIEQGYTLDMYKKLLDCFQGGWVHTNSMYANRIIGAGSVDASDPNNIKYGDVKCYDFASAYPACATRFKTAWGDYLPVDVKDFDSVKSQDVEDPDTRWFAKVEFVCVESAMCNTFWSLSKCEEIEFDTSDNSNIDNGRIYKCKRMVVWLDDFSYYIFKHAYDIQEEHCLELYCSEARYISKELILHILDLFHKKSEYKGIEELESQLGYIKSCLNSIAYGCAVYKEFGAEVSYNGTEWVVNRDQTLEDFVNTMAKKKPEKCFWALQDGIVIVSAARYCLWRLMIDGLDPHVVYGDTDSLKGLFNDHDKKIIDAYNQRVKDQQDKVCRELGIDPKEYLAVNANGKTKRLGVFEEEPSCEIIALGAKKYAEKIVAFKKDGTPYEKIVVTVSGLPKDAGVNKIKRLEDFTDQTLWRTSESDKLTSYHNWGDQPDCIWTDLHGVEYTSHEKFGIALIPTTYSLKMSPSYKEFLLFLLTGKIDNFDFFHDTPKILL